MAPRRTPRSPQPTLPVPPTPPVLDPGNFASPYTPGPTQRLTATSPRALPTQPPQGDTAIPSVPGPPALPGMDGSVDPNLGADQLFGDIGLTGLKRFAGHVYEEFLPQLWGNKAIQTYREMLDNDAMIGALLFSIEQLIRQVTWRVDCAADDAASEQCRAFIEECLGDMSQSFADTLSEILSMIPYGFSFHELVYKQRNGGLWDGGAESQYADGRIGWRKWALRAQDTRWAWQFDDDGGIQGMWQNAPPYYRNVYIPIEKALLFRPRLYKNNPEGRSVLRTAYRSWYFLKRFQEIEGIGVERDLAGFPVIFCPAEITDPNAATDLQAVYANLKATVTNIRRDALEGLVMPMVYDQNGHPLYDIKLLTTGGARQFNTTEIIARYEQRILQTVLADWIMLGHTQRGTQSLSQSKIDVFTAAITSWCQQIADVVNRYAIPRLLALNGMRPAKLPTLVPEKINEPDLKELAPFIASLAQAGMPLFPDADIENHFRDLLDVPELTDEEYAEREAKEAAQEAATQAAARAEYQRTQTAMQDPASPEARTVAAASAPPQEAPNGRD